MARSLISSASVGDYPVFGILGPLAPRNLHLCGIACRRESPETAAWRWQKLLLHGSHRLLFLRYQLVEAVDAQCNDDGMVLDIEKIPPVNPVEGSDEGTALARRAL